MKLDYSQIIQHSCLLKPPHYNVQITKTFQAFRPLSMFLTYTCRLKSQNSFISLFVVRNLTLTYWTTLKRHPQFAECFVYPKISTIFGLSARNYVWWVINYFFPSLVIFCDVKFVDCVLQFMSLLCASLKEEFFFHCFLSWNISTVSYFEMRFRLIVVITSFPFDFLSCFCIVVCSLKLNQRNIHLCLCSCQIDALSFLKYYFLWQIYCKIWY